MASIVNKNSTVPFLDLAGMHAPILEEIKREVGRVIDAHTFALGPVVEEFERNFAGYCGVEHCVGLNSGTSAVHVALLCAGVRPGDEVITTPYSWISTSWAISYAGAKPVYVDIDAQTYCLNPAKIEAAITPKTKALLPVHLFGHTADMDEIVRIGQKHGLAVIEDAAQAHGARHRGRRCGSLADIAAFSFYPGKNLGAFGEAGAVVTNNAEWAERARRLRDHAQQGRHRHVEIGFNYRMEAIQAAVLNVKLRHLDEWNRKRREVAGWYAEQLQDIPDVVLPQPAAWAEPIWHIYGIRHPKRDAMRRRLEQCGVQTGVHYPTPIHLQPAYVHLGYEVGDLPATEALASEQISLPMFPGMSENQVRRVADDLRSSESSMNRTLKSAPLKPACT